MIREPREPEDERTMNARNVALLGAVATIPAHAAAEEVDLAVVHRIKSEAFANGRVMDHLFFLTDVGGPRLTASPGERQAADWADLMQAAAIVASFAYNAATRPQLLPRKPLPKPLPAPRTEPLR
jgi:hypothetical protein